MPNRTSGGYASDSIRPSSACRRIAGCCAERATDGNRSGTNVPRPHLTSQRVSTGGHHHRPPCHGVLGFSRKRRHLCGELAYRREQVDQQRSRRELSLGGPQDRQEWSAVCGGRNSRHREGDRHQDREDHPELHVHHQAQLHQRCGFDSPLRMVHRLTAGPAVRRAARSKWKTRRSSQRRRFALDR